LIPLIDMDAYSTRQQGDAKNAGLDNVANAGAPAVSDRRRRGRGGRLPRQDLPGAAERHPGGGGGGRVIAMADDTHHLLVAASLAAGAANVRRQRKPTLADALKQAKKAGVDVSGATIEDGKVSLTFGENEDAKVTPLEQWRAKRRGQG
jgi:hypothetical protein